MMLYSRGVIERFAFVVAFLVVIPSAAREPVDSRSLFALPRKYEIYHQSIASQRIASEIALAKNGRQQVHSLRSE